MLPVAVARSQILRAQMLVPAARPFAVALLTGLWVHAAAARLAVGARGAAHVAVVGERHVVQAGAPLEQAALGVGRHLDVVPRRMVIEVVRAAVRLDAEHDARGLRGLQLHRRMVDNMLAEVLRGALGGALVIGRRRVVVHLAVGLVQDRSARRDVDRVLAHVFDRVHGRRLGRRAGAEGERHRVARGARGHHRIPVRDDAVPTDKARRPPLREHASELEPLALFQPHCPRDIVVVEAEQLTLIGSKEPAQLLNERRHVDGLIRRLGCLLEPRSVRTQLLTPAQLTEAFLDAPHARGDMLRLLLYIVQLLAERSKLGSMQTLMEVLSRRVDEPDPREHLASVDGAPLRALVLAYLFNLASVDGAPLRALVLAYLFNERGELVPLRTLLVVVALVVRSGQPVARHAPNVSEVRAGARFDAAVAALQAPLQVDHKAALVGAVTSRGRRKIRVVAQITQVVLLADRLVALLLGHRPLLLLLG